MKKLLFFFTVFSCQIAFAEDFDIQESLRAVYVDCIGIEDSLQEMKKMAGINTVITAVGTGTGVGAVATGVAKKQTDKAANAAEIRLQRLREIEANNPGLTSNQNYQSFIETVKNTNDIDVNSVLSKYSSFQATIDAENKKLTELTKKSKNLGNWRTGLLAGTAATGIASLAISVANRPDENLENRINTCVKSVDDLRKSFTANKAMGNETYDAKEIIDACSGYKYIDLKTLNKRATGALVSSAVSTATGVTGTIVSAVANSQKIRDDNTQSGKQKEKDLNTSSNILAVGATAASATATVFNATQIAELKRLIAVSEQCSGVLK